MFKNYIVLFIIIGLVLQGTLSATQNESVSQTVQQAESVAPQMSATLEASTIPLNFQLHMLRKMLLINKDNPPMSGAKLGLILGSTIGGAVGLFSAGLPEAIVGGGIFGLELGLIGALADYIDNNKHLKIFNPAENLSALLKNTNNLEAAIPERYRAIFNQLQSFRLRGPLYEKSFNEHAPEIVNFLVSDIDSILAGTKPVKDDYRSIKTQLENL